MLVLPVAIGNGGVKMKLLHLLPVVIGHGGVKMKLLHLKVDGKGLKRRESDIQVQHPTNV